MLFNNKRRFLKYLKCILIGLPIWFVVGILITFSPEFGKALGITEPVNAGKAVMFAFTGQVAGDLASGFLSQYFKSRKKIILMFMLISSVMTAVYLMFPTTDVAVFYTICALLGFANGYWTLFVTVAAEMFGTNLRATVATSAPNFVRGAIIPLTAVFIQLKASWGIVYAAGAVGLLSFLIAIIALKYLEETFSKDLNFVEED